MDILEVSKSVFVLIFSTNFNFYTCILYSFYVNSFFPIFIIKVIRRKTNKKQLKPYTFCEYEMLNKNIWE